MVQLLINYYLQIQTTYCILNELSADNRGIVFFLSLSYLWKTRTSYGSVSIYQYFIDKFMLMFVFILTDSSVFGEFNQCYMDMLWEQRTHNHRNNSVNLNYNIVHHLFDTSILICHLSWNFPTTCAFMFRDVYWV